MGLRADEITGRRLEREQLFVAEYLRHFNAAHAARKAGYSSASAGRTGYQLLQYPEIKEAIAEAVVARLDALKLDAEDVLKEWAAIVRADPNEIMQVRRACCRYCYGIDGRYQYTPAEREKEYAAWEASDKALTELFDEKGGTGFDARLEPNPQCFECFGEGTLTVHVADTRDMSPGARALFAGVKQTKDGIEVKLHSKEKALEFVARHIGMLKEKVEVEGNLGLIERLTRGRKRAGGDSQE